MAGEAARRANLEYIEAREEMKDALVQKMSYKYGKSADKDDGQFSVTSSAIRNEVDGLLVGAAAPVTQANLARLERRLARQAQGRPVEEDLLSMKSSISAYTTGSFMPRRAAGPGSGSMSYRDSRPATPAGSAQLSARGSGPRFAIGRAGQSLAIEAAKRSSPGPQESTQTSQVKVKKEAQDVEWSTLDKLAAKLHEKDAELQRAREKELQNRLKEDLDKQLADFRLKQVREKNEAKQYYENHIAPHGNWQDQENEKKRAEREKALTIQRDRESQIASDRARKEAERRLAQEEANNMVARVKQEEAQDKQETELRRKIRKERVQKALQDSSEGKAKAQQELKSKIDNEDKLLEAYRQRIVERDKRCQDATYQKVVVRRNMLEQTADARHQAEKQMQDETEAKVARERAAKDAKDIEAERTKADRTQQLKQENQKYLFEQMRQKTEAKERIRQEKKSLGSVLEVDAQKFTESETSRTSAQRQRALDHRAELERQIEAKMSSPVKKDTMSVSELAMNKKLIERVQRLQDDEGVSVTS